MKSKFDIWWETEGNHLDWTDMREVENYCRTAWENGAFCAKESPVNRMGEVGYRMEPMDDDLNEPLGQACVLGDTDCESCS